jgi:hypothetical protein
MSTTEVKWALPDNQADQWTIAEPGLVWHDRQTEPPEEILSTTEKIIIRHWMDETSAQDWISFVQQYNPISATIIQ